MPPTRPNHGFSLVELLLALVLLELLAIASLNTLILLHRQRRGFLERAATDHARLAAIRDAMTDPACHASPVTGSHSFTLPASEGRPAITASVRCGP